MTITIPTKNVINSKGQLIRWESYHRDKDNMTVSHFNGYYVVLSYGKKTKTKKKEIPVKQYNVTKDSDGKVNCTCPSHQDKNEICKHMIAVWIQAQDEREKKTEDIQKYIARW
ncbi:MAG TPA: SWIM zinc finger domain-containing protein [Candidatus Eremiobacteraeota bacterium]|nr:SWIM zinc finger domain-containing protein [Candidatus Eremiobacteraeota bacterium]